MTLMSVRDASYGAVDSIYCQSGSFFALIIRCIRGKHRIFKVLGRMSHKPKRVTYSKIGAEVPAASDADDRVMI